GYATRAKRMLDWLVSIQLPDGGFEGGMIDQAPKVPVTFNTGQILIGLAAGAERLGSPYDAAMHKAAMWLLGTMDDDGAWRKFPTPFAANGEKAYETHVAWGLLEAARVSKNEAYLEGAMRNIRWALTKQLENGWVMDCCLTEPNAPLTHTLGYYLRGLVEAYRATKDAEVLEAALRTAHGLHGALQEDGYLPGRLDWNFHPTVDWSCLTGTAQIAHSWILLAEATEEWGLYRSAEVALGYVARRVSRDGEADVRGAVKGSYPVDGGYCTLQYPNWATKFFIDAALEFEAAGLRNRSKQGRAAANGAVRNEAELRAMANEQ
ncbi:MAG: hypothetical protein IT290_01940, partial [Deltaproteobacteria bacterium]|nr:hypothetical protein [Deltaproteobacteria bacterium]